MKKFVACMSAVALVSTLAACGGADQPTKDVVANDMNAMTADSNNPFAQSEMTMDKAMMAAVGVNAADTWVRKMIEHHRGAVEMSRVVLTQNPTADVARMAQMTIDMQGKEIADLEKMIASGAPDPASAALYRPAAMQMHQAMMSATGGNISESYLTKMLAHHQGAVAMSDVALANGASGPVRAQIEQTKATQQQEVAMVQAMLRGEPMPSTATAPVEAPSAASAPEAKPSAAPKTVAAKPTTAKPKAAPAAEPMAPGDTCSAEHRAAGHC